MDDKKFASSTISDATSLIPLIGEGPNYWVVVQYEFEMYSRIGEMQRHIPHDVALKNALTESFLLHTRNLCELVGPDSKKRGDDLRLTDLFPDWETGSKYIDVKGLIADLVSVYGEDVPETPRWTLNKRLAHPTRPRADKDGHDYTHIVQLLDAKIRGVFNELITLRGQSARSASRICGGR
jgi:hypothetical protein